VGNELSSFLGGRPAHACFQCGACVAECPTSQYVPGFSPRKILLQVLLGLREELEKPDALVWKCTSCYTCVERCPQGVRPGEVIAALRNMLAKKGLAPKNLVDVFNSVRKEGCTVPKSGHIERRRQELGLPPVDDSAREELKILLKESLLPRSSRGEGRI
jgi:heterodisulfide reductase subunit C